MTKKSYDTEFKKTIVSLYQSGKTVEELCSEFSISLSSVNRWRKEFGVDNTSKDTENLEDKQRIKALEKQLKNIKLERDILKKAVSIFSKNDK